MIAVLSPKTGNRSICSKRAAAPNPAIACSPKTLIYANTTKLPTEINSKVAEIGAD